MEGIALTKQDETEATPAPQPRLQPKIKADELILNTRQRRDDVLKGNAGEASAWGHAPCNYELNRAADRRLTRVASLLGSQATQVDHVRAAVQVSTKRVFIWPAEDEDPDRLPVNRIEYSAWINLFDLLAPEKIKIQTGYQERYAVQYAPDDAPVTPSIMIDLNRPLERRPDKKRRRKAAEKAAEPAPAPEGKEA